MTLSPLCAVDVQAPASASDPASKPTAARIDRDDFLQLRIAGGRHDLPVDHRGGALFLEWTTVAAPIVADDFGARAVHSVLSAGASARPAISSQRGGLFLKGCAVEGDIVCNGILGVCLEDSVVTGDIHSPFLSLGPNATVRGRVHVAEGSSTVGSNCQVDVLEVSPPREWPDDVPTVFMRDGARIGRILCHAPTMKLSMEGSAMVSEPLAPCIQVKRLPAVDPDAEDFDQSGEELSPMSQWTFGERSRDLDARLFSSVPPARPSPHNAP